MSDIIHSKWALSKGVIWTTIGTLNYLAVLLRIGLKLQIQFQFLKVSNATDDWSQLKPWGQSDMLIAFEVFADVRIEWDATGYTPTLGMQSEMFKQETPPADPGTVDWTSCVKS